MFKAFLALCAAVVVFAAVSRGDAQMAITAVPYVASPSLESCRVFSTRPGVLLGYSVANQATAGMAMVFDANVAPSAGAVVPSAPVVQMAATTSINVNLAIPMRFNNGLVICFSSGTVPFTYAVSATAELGAQFQ